ncbi:axin interactor, dorsalization-associated protein isoform X4 [Mobula birostris]|uniref:axin interactor, dorsalization-associated protein isoform X4 n=1 Tax=Mobula birostris TaxID=1983395 RepID=UPI003B2835A9
MTDINKMIQKWHASFKKGTDFDSWGQLVEAIDEYQILARHLQKEVQSTASSSELSEDQKKTLSKIATCLELRSTALQTTQSQEAFKLEDLKTLEPILKNILSYNKDFPFDVQPVPIRKILAPGEEENLEFEEEEDGGAGTPDFFTTRVPDINGVDLTPVQDTPVATRKEDTYIHFAVDVEIQKHIEKLPKGAAIFFEFKHYKPKKKFTSTKCFAFMEMDEIKAGEIVIELYKKPTDFKRKKLHLLTRKPLYLHLHQTLHKE